MESLVSFILNNAQTVRDGGIIGSILQNVQIFNNSNVKHDAMPYVVSTRMTGGYVAALFFGILWMLALISVMILLFYLHCKKSKLNFKGNRKWKFNLTNSKEGKSDSSVGEIVQMFILIIFLIPIILLICFCLSNVSQIHNSLSQSAQSFEANSTEDSPAILPAIKKSLFYLRYYLSTFADNARQNTASVVGEIIQATKNMQTETMKDFNPKLMRDLGVANTFKYGGQMTKVVVNFFDISNALVSNQTAYKEVIDSIYPRIMDPSFRLFDFISDIKKSFESVSNCDQNCLELQKFFSQPFVEVTEFPDINFATSFLFVMKKQNKTRDSVIAQTQHGRIQMEKTMNKTQRKMRKLLDIDGTIRNMTDETWTKMDQKFSKTVELIDNITLILESDKTTKKVSRYSSILLIILTIPVLFAITILIFALTVILSLFVRPSKSLNVGLQYGLYFSLFLLSIIIITSTLTFLYGGKIETELCRYIRTNQPQSNVPNDTKLVLDKYINNFLKDTLPKIAASMPKSDFPLPKPKNVLFGLLYKCRQNEPILEAIDAISTLDTAALSKPEISQKFVNIGRQLLIESLNETDPKKMLPPDMQETLQQASQLEMFKLHDIDENIKRVPGSPIHVSNNGIKTEISPGLFLDRIQKYLSLYVYDPAVKNNLQSSLDKLMPMLEKFNIITDRVRDIFRKMKLIPQIMPIVENLKKSLNSMLILLNNKTALIEIGNDKFNKIIVSSTPQKAAGIMAKYGPKMMSKLGHCKPLYEAYQSVIDTTCDVIVMKINIYWLYLGCLGLFLTCFLSVVYLMMFRTLNSSPRNTIDIDMSKEPNQLAGKALVDNYITENEKAQV